MQYIICEDQIVNLKELNNCGQIMSVGEFIQNILDQNFIDYDGFARFVVSKYGKDYEIEDVTYSIFFNEVYFKDESLGNIIDFCRMEHIKKIVWYNR